MKKAFFMDFELDTEGSTLFPRSETEILVEKAVELLKVRKKAPNILDIGTGSGNIAISLTNYIPSSRIVALDISDTAIRVAQRNALKYGVESRIKFIKSDLFNNLDIKYKHFFDCVISNPPYIALEDFKMLPGAVKDDPYLALYGGSDGMDFYRKISRKVHLFLKEKGILLMEVGYNQAASVKKMLESLDEFSDIEIFKDYSGIDRIVKARRWKS